jgi:hypothetical protein
MLVRGLVFISIVLIGLGCQKRKAAPIYIDTPKAIPQEKNQIIEDVNGLAPTIYFVPILNVKNLDCKGEPVQPIKNIQGKTISEVCDTDYKACVQQGTCLLNEAAGMRIINFTTRRGKIPLFSDKIKKECPFGLGLKNICLDPYYTAAGDLNFHKLGDVIFVPSARGLKLPTGETHDGYFVVRDSGSNLKSEKRFDFFTGFDKDTEVSNVFKILGLDDKENRFKYEKVSEDIAAKVRMKRNYPKINRKQQQQAADFFKKVMQK